jgi:hypothetical protein
MKIHTGEKPYECNLCNKKISQSSRLAYHTKNRVCEKNNLSNLGLNYFISFKPHKEN